MRKEGEPETAVEISSSQGIQVGNSNVQYNAWPAKAMLDPKSLSFLSPEATLARLLQMSHDEIVDLFARVTSPGDAAEVIKALAAADETKLVSVLADLNLRKAAELITPVEAEVPWLKSLPVAAAAIASRAAEIKWAYARETDRLQRVRSRGYARRYPKGRIYWTENNGAQDVVDEIGGQFDDIIAAAGFPTAAVSPATWSPFSTGGVYQVFEAGAVHYSPKVGSWLVPRELSDCYRRLGGSGSWLGFPVGSVDRSPYLQSLAESQSGAWCVQPFEGGSIYWFRERPGPVGFLRRHRETSPPIEFPQGPFPVCRAFIQYLDAVYGAGNWIPCEIEGGLKVLRHVQLAQKQLFTIDGNRSAGRRDVEVYSSDAYGVYAVEPRVRKFLEGRVFPGLGVPTAEWDGVKQDFEGGSVYRSPANRLIAVPALTVEMISERSFSGKLGVPLEHEQTIGASGTDRIQFFENGAVILRDGRREILLRA